jgi:uncharacterized protein YukE
VTARAGEWHLLGHDRDPVTGEPDHVQRLAQGYRSTAEDIERLTGQLRRLGDLEGWRGEAAQRFAEAADDLAAELGGAERRYRDLADAVQSWVRPLSRARDESAGALSQAVTAEDDRRRHATDPYVDVVEPTPDQVAAQNRTTAAREDAEQRLSAARHRLDEVLEDLDRAAGEVADKIGAAAEHGADGLWDDVGGWVREHAPLLERIATWLGRIALVLAVITVLVVVFVAAPAALLVGALFWGGVAVTGLQLGLHATMMASDAGDVTWLDIGMDVVGLVTAGLGGALARVVAKGAGSLRAGAATIADDAGRTAQQALESGAANYTRAGNAARITDPTNPLRRWGDQYLDDAAERVTQAGRTEADSVLDGAVTQASRGQRVQAMDHDLAADLAELERLGAMQLDEGLRAQLAQLRLQGGIAAGANLTGLAGQTAEGIDDLGPDWKDPVADRGSGVYWRLTH